MNIGIQQHTELRLPTTQESPCLYFAWVEFEIAMLRLKEKHRLGRSALMVSNDGKAKIIVRV